MKRFFLLICYLILVNGQCNFTYNVKGAEYDLRWRYDPSDQKLHFHLVYSYLKNDYDYIGIGFGEKIVSRCCSTDCSSS